MLQKLSKCEVKAWLCWNSIILPPLRFYVKSNFGKFKRSNDVILAISGTQNFEFWKLLKFTKNQNWEPLKLSKMTFLDHLNSPKFDFTSNLSIGKMIIFQQSQALISHFESFWSIVDVYDLILDFPPPPLCSRNFQKVKFRLDFVEI